MKMNPMLILWLVLLVAFLVAEAACPIHLVSIWFGAGALVAGIVALLGGELWLQITLFFLVSCGLLAAMWPLVKKVLSPRIVKTNVDSVIGSQGYVTEKVDNLSATGQVKLGGMYWTARSTSGKPIPSGSRIQVDSIEGVKVLVSEVPVSATVKL